MAARSGPWAEVFLTPNRREQRSRRGHKAGGTSPQSLREGRGAEWQRLGSKATFSAGVTPRSVLEWTRSRLDLGLFIHSFTVLCAMPGARVKQGIEQMGPAHGAYSL